MTDRTHHQPAKTRLSGLDEAEIAQLRARLEKAVAKVCPAWMAVQADDLVQVSLLRVLDVVAKSEQDRTFNASYLYRVAYSALIDELRRARWRREVPLDNDQAEPMPIEEEAVSPEQRFAGRQLGDAITACLNEMIASRRRAVVLHLHGHSASESARLLGHRIKQVRNLVYRGLTDLRSCLRRKGLRP